MNQDKQTINSHLESYLDYYCGLAQTPGFAILLKGQWGSGKTWFIKQYCEKLKEGKQNKCLYVSLYGMTSFSEIEYAFFQQLHPLLSSKGMEITGKILKSFLKGALKIDLNYDNKDDGTLNFQLPEINPPEYLKNIDKSIIIFDDLERCKIDLDNLLGYINFFVEHRDLKVILIADEDKLLKNCNYKDIKEKLIGKTFNVSLNFEGALENFITIVHHSNVRNFLFNNKKLIQDWYELAKYGNLRNLKQVILDFERIFDSLPEKARSKPDLLQELLKILIAFSIEISRGNILSKDIIKLQDEYVIRTSKRVLRQSSSTNTNDKHEESNSLQEVLDRYALFNLHEPFPSLL